MTKVNELVQFDQNFDLKKKGSLKKFPMSTASMSPKTLGAYLRLCLQN